MVREVEGDPHMLVRAMSEPVEEVEEPFRLGRWDGIGRNRWSDGKGKVGGLGEGGLTSS